MKMNEIKYREITENEVKKWVNDIKSRIVYNKDGGLDLSNFGGKMKYETPEEILRFDDGYDFYYPVCITSKGEIISLALIIKGINRIILAYVQVWNRKLDTYVIRIAYEIE